MTRAVMRISELRGILQIGEKPKRLATMWFRWRTRKTFNWAPLSKDDLQRTAELGRRFGWNSEGIYPLDTGKVSP